MPLSRLNKIRDPRALRSLGLTGLLLLFAVLPVRAAPPVLETSQSLATAGDFRLSWQGGAEGAVYELQQSAAQGFTETRTRYRGPDTATQLSGLPDGDYSYRVRVVDPGPSAWSEAVTVEVRHHPLSRALGFFSVGLVVFVATVILITRGARDD